MMMMEEVPREEKDRGAMEILANPQNCSEVTRRGDDPDGSDSGSVAGDTRETVILAVSYSGGRLGAALYLQATTTIRLVHDVAEEDDFSVLKSLLADTRPTMILANRGQDGALLALLTRMCADNTAILPRAIEEASTDMESQRTLEREEPEKEEEEDEDDIDARPHLLPNNAYNCEKALSRVEELFHSEALSECEHGLILRFRIDTLATNMVRACGALLLYMDSARAGVEFEHLGVRTPVTAIRTLLVQQMVEMDDLTYRSLGIFAEEKGSDATIKNASHAKSVPRQRLSLYGLLNRCRSAPGKRLLRKWLERPTRDLTVLRQRQDAIQFMMFEGNIDVVHFLQKSLCHIRSLKTISKRLRASNMEVADWSALHSTLTHVRGIVHMVNESRVPLEIIEPFKRYFDSRLAEGTSVMTALIDYDESFATSEWIRSWTASIYRCLPARLTAEAQAESMRLGVRECSAEYIPMIGYILTLPSNFDIEQYPEYKSLTYVYSDGGYVHVKSERMSILDEEIGDVKMVIIDRESSIMLRLERQLVEHLPCFLECMRAVAILDVVLALSVVAKENSWTRPTLVEKPVIYADGVVHPLAKLTCDGPFVANSVISDSENRKVHIFTGPNACGKSVYLKQVGLLVFLAHIGSFVPTSMHCEIGVCSGIFTRLYTIDGVLDGMSTFAKDLGQFARSLRRADEHSLVIIDEFGKGTITEVGLSLLTATMEHWINKGANSCPHLLLATHFHALVDLIEMDPEKEDLLRFQTMQVLKKGPKLIFQFKLVEGVVDCSFAAYAAAKVGIRDDIIDRANQVYQHLRNGGRLHDVEPPKEVEAKNKWLAGRMESVLSVLEKSGLGKGSGGRGEEEEDDLGSQANANTPEGMKRLTEKLRSLIFTKSELAALARGEENWVEEDWRDGDEDEETAEKERDEGEESAEKESGAREDERHSLEGETETIERTITVSSDVTSWEDRSRATSIIGDQNRNGADSEEQELSELVSGRNTTEGTRREELAYERSFESVSEEVEGEDAVEEELEEQVSVMSSQRGGILKTSKNTSAFDRAERSTFSVSFSTAVTMLMGGENEELAGGKDGDTVVDDNFRSSPRRKSDVIIDELFMGRSAKRHDNRGEKREAESGERVSEGERVRTVDEDKEQGSETSDICCRVRRLRSC